MQTFETTAPHPQVSFSVVHEAVDQFRHNEGTWILAALIYLSIVWGLGHITNRISGFAKSSPGMPAVIRLFIPIDTSMMSKHPILLPLSLVVTTITFFLLAGLYRMAAKKIHGHRFTLRDLVLTSSAEAQSLFAYAIVIWIYRNCRQLALSYVWYQSILHPESPIYRTSLYLGFTLEILIYITFEGLFMFTFPLIVDQQMNLIDALTKSFTALKHQWVMALLFSIVVEIISLIGIFLCLVGILMTIPIGILAVTILYRNFFIGSSSPPPPSGKKLFEPAIPPGS